MLFGLTYSSVLAIHIISFLWNITLVIYADINAALWVLGKKSHLNGTLLHWLHRGIILGLTVSIISGTLLFSTVSSYLLQQPAFITKIVLVVALVINAFLINKHMDIATKQPFSELTMKERVPLFISGIVSTLAWVGVFISAQFLGL